MHIRIADPERDAEAVAAIYRPAVEDSIASFEEVVPTAGEMGYAGIALPNPRALPFTSESAWG